MTGDGGSRRKGESTAARRERLAAELRTNLTKRKAQARARARHDDAAAAADLVPQSPAAPAAKPGAAAEPPPECSSSGEPEGQVRPASRR